MGVPAHSRAGGRTLLVGISGFGASALVTSFAVLSVQTDAAAVAVTTVGGTVILAIAALVSGVSALRMRRSWNRTTWVLMSLALLMTAGGAALRSTAILGGWSGLAVAAEFTYVIGILAMAGSLIAWPWLHRGTVSLAMPTAATFASVALAASAFWLAAGRRLAREAFVGGAIPATQVLAYLGVLLMIAAAAAFSLACARALKCDPRSTAQVVAAAGVLCIVLGDLGWLSLVAQGGWRPGSFGDFIHLAGQILIATGASFALDIDRDTSETGEAHR